MSCMVDFPDYSGLFSSVIVMCMVDFSGYSGLFSSVIVKCMADFPDNSGLFSSVIVMCMVDFPVYSGLFPSEIVMCMVDFPGYSGQFSGVIVMCMADFQVTRRFLECLYVSVYSEGGKISFIIYIVGLSFYIGLGITCLVGTDLTDTLMLKGKVRSEVRTEIGATSQENLSSGFETSY